MAFETVVKNLTELGADPQLVAQLIANEKVATGLRQYVESGLRQEDYDRKMNSGKAEIAAAKQELDEFKARLEADRVRMNGQFMTAQQEREAAESRLAAVQAKAKTLGQVYGIDAEKELFGETTVQPPAKQSHNGEVAVSPDLDKRIGALEDLFRTNVNFEVELHDVMRQHMELFPDKPLVMKEILDDAVKQRRSPTQVWDDKFGATAKRQEITAEKYRAEGRAAAETEYKQKLSEQKVNPFGIATPPSAVFQAAANKGGNKAPLNSRQQNQAGAIQRATEALLSHKYAPGNAVANH
jgi:hypothetical protein